MKRDTNSERTAAVLAALTIRPEAPGLAAYTTSAATWLEGIPHRAPFLPLPAVWSAKRSAYWVGLKATLPAASVPAPKPAPRKASAPARQRAGSDVPAGWGEAAWEHYQAARRATTYDALNHIPLASAAMRGCEKREGKAGMAPSTVIRFATIPPPAPDASDSERKKHAAAERLQAARMKRAAAMGLSWDLIPAPRPVVVPADPQPAEDGAPDERVAA
jgi:hypothetical protein